MYVSTCGKQLEAVKHSERSDIEQRSTGEMAAALLRARGMIGLWRTPLRSRLRLLPLGRLAISCRANNGDGAKFPPISIESGVRRAIEEGRPVVALESTIISHGMPYPDNLAMAR